MLMMNSFNLCPMGFQPYLASPPRVPPAIRPGGRGSRLVRKQCPATAGGVLPADHEDSPFRQLELAELWEGVGRTRVRQHVNPLRREHQVVTAAPDWHTTYQQPEAPLVVDMGCGPGRFLLLLHQQRVKAGAMPANYLGLEIRKPLVDRANEWSARLGYNQHVHFLCTNATISLAHLLQSYPGKVSMVTIQMPDPHFKRRHFKRRIFQPQLVQDVAQLLPPGGQLFLQSDVLDVACAMRDMFEEYAGQYFRPSQHHHQKDAVFWEEAKTDKLDTQAQLDGETIGLASVDSDQQAEDEGSAPQDEGTNFVSAWAEQGWLKSNPIEVPTEREHYVLQQGLPVYRMLLERV